MVEITRDRTVSAPGKVLMAGGYLVLDRENPGLVVATDARFYVSVEAAPGESMVRVLSPQFESSSREYRLSVDNDKTVLNQIGGEDTSSNKFIEASLQYAMAFIRILAPLTFEEILRSSVLVTINADNDFYSQSEELHRRGLELTRSSLEQLPRFCHTQTTLKDVYKTGLGSSAALVTSLVASLLIYYAVVSSSLLLEEMTLIHNLAQFCHCLAQGKIGSGFDVSSAVFGSQLYRRFTPDLIQPILSNPQDFSDAELISFIHPLKSKWDTEVMPFSLPERMKMVLADVHGGSNSPKMASTVIKWKKENPKEAAHYWKELGHNNHKVGDIFQQLSKLASQNPAEYQDALEEFSKRPAKEAVLITPPNKCYALLAEVFVTYETIRQLFRELSAKTQVLIEPPEQTRLLDACLSVPGTLIAGVPGAGGYDAIFCIVLNDEALAKIDALWSTWQESDMIVCPLLTTESTGGAGLKCIE